MGLFDDYLQYDGGDFFRQYTKELENKTLNPYFTKEMLKSVFSNFANYKDNIRIQNGNIIIDSDVPVGGTLYKDGRAFGTIIDKNGEDVSVSIFGNNNNAAIIMLHNNNKELPAIREHLDKVWNELFKRIDRKYKKNLFFAGGCFQSLALGEPINDYDLFCNNWVAAREIAAIITKEFSHSLVNTNKCLYFYVGDYHINFVKHVFGTPEETIKKFDFGHCMSYYTAEGAIHTGQLGSKLLIFNTEASNCIGSIFRLKKFLARGYSIHSDQLKAVLSKTLDNIDTFFGSDTYIYQESLEQFTSFYQGNSQ